ncbi:MAG: DUF4760 domain-containing protein, partial [Blastocatellia bacterium]
VWERVKAIIPESRERFANKAFAANIQKAAQRYETWIEARSPGHVAKMREWMKQMRPQQTTAAKA